MKITKDLVFKVTLPIASGIICWFIGKVYMQNKIMKHKKVDLCICQNGDNLSNGKVYMTFPDEKTFNEVLKMKCVVCNVVHVKQKETKLDKNPYKIA